MARAGAGTVSAPASPAAIDWAAREATARARLQVAPGDAAARFALGIALLERGRAIAAASELAQARALAPGDAAIAAQHARALALLQRQPEAIAAADAALALSPADAATLDTLGVVYTRGNAHRRAVALFQHAVAVDPARAAPRYNLAVSLTFCGELDAAGREYEALLARHPRHWRAHLALSRLRRQTPADNHVERLQALLPAADTDPDAEVHLHHALAKELDDLGEHARAFAHLSAAKRRRRAAAGDVIGRERALFDAIRARCATPLDPPGAQAPVDRPLFVVGMPRSGTTLVERILSGHPAVHSAGELQDFAVALKRASGSRTRPLLDADVLQRLDHVDWPEVGAAYHASTRAVSGDLPHFVDKLPHNFLHAGFIARALPGARIICLRRGALDTCVGNYRQLFARTSPYYDYALDLLDTGRYWLLFDALCAHWRAMLPGRWLEVGYEALVDDPEATARRMFAHAGLPWDPAVLRIEDNVAPVATASAVQVREPLHRRGIGRWRDHADEVVPLRRLLEAAGAITRD